MASQINHQSIQSLLKDTEAGFPHEDCYTCECFLGFITRLEIDTDKSLKPIFAEYKPDKHLVHSCMGCDPCPPADAFAKYMREKRLIHL